MRTHPTNGSNHQISVVVRDQTPMLHTMNPSNYKMLPNQGGQGSLLLESTLLSPYRLAPKLSWTPPASQNTGESSIKRLGGCLLKLKRGIKTLKMMGKLGVPIRPRAVSEKQVETMNWELFPREFLIRQQDG